MGAATTSLPLSAAAATGTVSGWSHGRAERHHDQDQDDPARTGAGAHTGPAGRFGRLGYEAEILAWVAREFESGAFRFTWTQGTGPRRWLLGTFGPLAALATVSAAIYGAAAYWWYQLAQWQNGTSIWPWRWSSFELTPFSIAGWTVLSMALALLCGVLIRRVLPAMIAFIVTLGACAYVSQTWLRPWLFGIGTTVKQVAYQPYSHLIWLELARNGILVAVAALAVLASVCWLRIRPAD